jgi:UPF0176 protein
MPSTNSSAYAITAFYRFVSLSETRLATLKEIIESEGQRLGLHGLLLLATEGINATVCGTPEAIVAFRAFITNQPEFGDILFKDSHADFLVFKRWKVEVRTEIVTAEMPGIFPHSAQNRHLTPQEWHRIVTQEKDAIVLDTRNDYEVKIGKFKDAIDPQLNIFSDFPEYLTSHPLPKDQKILIYCTGGIRCEKAILTMQEQGYENVYQLQGGILNYFEAFPDGGAYEGECFLFDHRVAVDSHLEPTKQYTLCPHCGDPAFASITCAYCGEAGMVCENCLPVKACSKNCAFHVNKGTKPQSQRTIKKL